MEWSRIKRWLLGPPLRTRQLAQERLPKWKALAVFSSDALSSVAYATEEILIVLAAVGIGAFFYAPLIALAIVILLFLVTLSYRQIIYAFPSGGGAYIVAKEHLGTRLSLLAGAALVIDYVLTVAVSISSGVAALTSAFPELYPWRVGIAVLLVVVLMFLNLRGIRESATLFAYPTYLFVVLILVLLTTGGFRLWQEGWQGYGSADGSVSPAGLTASAWGWFVLMRAFASGCSAMTGVEAISNGVPAFRAPAPRNAAITMMWMSALLGTMFLGITLLAYGFGIAPKEQETVVSQLAEHVFGRGPVYYGIQLATTLILFLAANTAFAAFPQLASNMAQDGFLPRSLTARGDRLVFSRGIVLLSLLSIFLLVVFRSDTHALIPLYAIGVFLSFTIGQWGIAKLLWERRGEKWKTKFLITALGGSVTAVVTLVNLAAKFSSGAWIVAIAIPLFIAVFRAIHRHYMQIAAHLRFDLSKRPDARPCKVIIPISGVTRVVAQSVAYAKSISNDVVAVTVAFDDDQAAKLRQRWDSWDPGVPLVILRSPYRTLLSPLLRYIDHAVEQEPGAFVTVLIPQFLVNKWWHAFLHNQTAFLLRAVLILRKDVVVATIPYHLQS